MTRWPAAEHLRQRGFRVIEAVDVTEALGVAACGVRIDAVFSDVTPADGMDAYTVPRWFTRHRPQIPILLTSVNGRSDAAAMSAHWSFVSKPYEPPQIEALLRALLGQ